MEIAYNNKIYTIPPPFDECYFGYAPTKEMTVMNPYSKHSCTLPTFAYAVFEVILSTNMTQDDDLRDSGIDWFKKNFYNQYLILLD